ncbi:39S ribosomal protein L21, mitochondrial isoform X4 [Apteryx rowi]|nr:39S ribosomal protein L21, mitochondrial isoform X4 [Apteryx rowi]XP_025937831.1 39S ribosomal protein L21, mitochondrial isoform X4 [Apteryx rowi]XP_025937832.1 39S ribosomal protein L21, mitochondrial isoform X4 [Apteryx rowi]XP_025937833.1 39S ribosomal protein L21, mitochondrial isoform X4 [Apteryx rowi]
MIATGQYGRLFAVVHFASKQWKVTSEDLIMMDNVLEAECGDRIRMEKVLLVGADDFTLIGRPLLGTQRCNPSLSPGYLPILPVAADLGKYMTTCSRPVLLPERQAEMQERSCPRGGYRDRKDGVMAKN